MVMALLTASQIDTTEGAPSAAITMISVLSTDVLGLIKQIVYLEVPERTYGSSKNLRGTNSISDD